ncbi:MAG: hemerythrin domain-containing protein [Planctomycetota bacterium]
MSTLKLGLLVVTNPIQTLLAEHALHRRLLRVFERLARGLDQGRFPSEDVALVLRYLREFVERSHHHRESLAIHPLVLAVGGDDHAELLGRLIGDHQETSDLLESLCMLWEPTDLLGEERAIFAQLAQTYIARLRRHMTEEELTIYPLAARASAEELADLGAELERMATNHPGVSHWSSVVAQLEERWPA